MKNFFLMIAFLVGLFALSCSPPVTDTSPQNHQTYQQATDVGLVSSDGVVYAKDFVAVTVANTPSSSIPIIRAVDETTPPVDPAPLPTGALGFVKNNIAVLAVGLLAFLKMVVNLTPTDKDNKVFGVLDNIINWIIPNYKTGGGTHT